MNKNFDHKEYYKIPFSMKFWFERNIILLKVIIVFSIDNNTFVHVSFSSLDLIPTIFVRECFYQAPFSSDLCFKSDPFF